MIIKVSAKAGSFFPNNKRRGNSVSRLIKNETVLYSDSF